MAGRPRATGGGGVVFVDPSIDGLAACTLDGCPRTARPPSLISTGLIAGTLHARGVRAPVAGRRDRLLWSRIDSLTSVGPYDIRAVLRFLDHVPDRDRARAAARPAEPDDPGERGGAGAGRSRRGARRRSTSPRCQTPLPGTCSTGR